MKLEELLKRVPDRIPAAPAAATDRVRERVLAAIPQTHAPGARRAVLILAAALVGVVAFGAGYWTGPTQAAADLTIGARPDTVPAYRSTEVTLFGTVPSGRPASLSTSRRTSAASQACTTSSRACARKDRASGR